MASKSKWVVVVSETIEGETTTQVVSDVYATEQEAEDFAVQVQVSMPGCVVEVATEEEAAQVVTA